MVFLSLIKEPKQRAVCVCMCVYIYIYIYSKLQVAEELSGFILLRVME